jgi:hypothetical protein
MPYSWRKFCLSATRIQANINLNTTLQTIYLDLVNRAEEIRLPASFKQGNRADVYYSNVITITSIIPLINEVISSPIQASVLSYYVRAEIPENLEEFLAVGEELKLKELRASQLPDREQQLDYTCLFTSSEMGFIGIHPDIPTFGIPGAVPTKLIRTFQTGLSNLKRNIEIFYTFTNLRGMLVGT